MDNLQSIRQKFRGKRAELKMTQEKLAEKVGISKQVYSLFESGKTQKIDLLLFLKICDVLGLDFRELCGMTWAGVKKK